MSILVCTVVWMMLLAEFGMIALCYKLDDLRFTFHTILFKVPFIVLLVFTLFFDSELLVGFAMLIYFITIFCQDIFFRKYHNSRISIAMLFVYLSMIFCSIILLLLGLPTYTLLLNPLSIILGFVINRKDFFPKQ